MHPAKRKKTSAIMNSILTTKRSFRNFTPLNLSLPRRSLALGIIAFFAASCGRDGPRPANDGGGKTSDHPAAGTTGTGGSRNSDNSDENAGKGLSGTRPDDNIPIPREGRN